MAKKITTIGGQALMEGIMMVGPTRTAAAFCDENGTITTEDIEAVSYTHLSPWSPARWPSSGFLPP